MAKRSKLVSRATGAFVAASSVLLASSGYSGAGEQSGSAHQFGFAAINERDEINLADYHGKVVLVVNTASFCGFTHQYSGLQELWQKYQNMKLVVLGVPSNDFGNQEPKSESDIKTFCQGAFNVTFPMTSKYHVKGANAHAFYRWIDEVTEGKAVPRWNFHKILIGADGRLVQWFPSSINPTSAKIIDAIEREIKKAGALEG